MRWNASLHVHFTSAYDLACICYQCCARVSCSSTVVVVVVVLVVVVVVVAVGAAAAAAGAAATAAAAAAVVVDVVISLTSVHKKLVDVVQETGLRLIWSISRCLVSLPLAVEPVGGWTTESVTHGQCDARPIRLPSQPQSVTALWPVPNYTAW